MTSKDELMDLIQQCRTSLDKDLPTELSSLPSDLDTLLDRFRKIDGEEDSVPSVILYHNIL